MPKEDMFSNRIHESRKIYVQIKSFTFHLQRANTVVGCGLIMEFKTYLGVFLRCGIGFFVLKTRGCNI
jgi:hypothetical protein